MEVETFSGQMRTYTDKDKLIIELQERGFEMPIDEVMQSVQKRWDNFVAESGCDAKMEITMKPGFSFPNGQEWSWNGFGDSIAIAMLLTLTDIDELLRSLKRKETYNGDDVDFMLSKIIIWSLRASLNQDKDAYEMEEDFNGKYPFELDDPYLSSDLIAEGKALRVMYDLMNQEM